MRRYLAKRLLPITVRILHSRVFRCTSENILNIFCTFLCGIAQITVSYIFEDDDLEKISTVIKEHNLELVHDIIEQPWKQKAIHFYDYDKHLIEIGESFENMAYRLYTENYPKEEVLKYSFLTEEELRTIIRKRDNQRGNTEAS